MNRIAIALLTLAAMIPLTYAQQASQPISQPQCGLTEATSPAIRGVRLGMSTEQLLGLFPARRRDLPDTIDRIKSAGSGESVRLSFDTVADARGDNFAGVSSVSAGLANNRVTEFTISYAGATWRNIDEWIGKLAESLKLPAARHWVVGPSETPNKVLRCNGIEIEAMIQGGGGSITVRNAEYAKGGEERRNPLEERKRREFKP